MSYLQEQHPCRRIPPPERGTTSHRVKYEYTSPQPRSLYSRGGRVHPFYAGGTGSFSAGEADIVFTMGREGVSIYHYSVGDGSRSRIDPDFSGILKKLEKVLKVDQLEKYENKLGWPL